MLGVSCTCHSYISYYELHVRGPRGGGCSVWETRVQERKGSAYRQVFSMKEWAFSTPTSLLSHLLGMESLRFGGKLSPTALVSGLGGSLAVARVNSAYHLSPCCSHMMLLGQPVLVLGVSCILWGMKPQGETLAWCDGHFSFGSEHTLSLWVLLTNKTSGGWRGLTDLFRTNRAEPRRPGKGAQFPEI